MIRRAVDTIRMALGSLWSNPLRTALTLIGIVIGTAAVIAMASATEGLRRRVTQDLALLGAGVFQVQRQPMQIRSRRERDLYERRKPLTQADVIALAQGCKRCLRVAGESWSGLPGKTIRASGRTKATNTQLGGAMAGFFENNGFVIDRGRAIDEGDVATAAPSVVLGADVVDSILEGLDPVGKLVTISDATYRVVGTIERRGNSMDGGSSDNLVVIPLTVFTARGYQTDESLNITIAASDPDRIEAAQDEVIALLRRRRGTPPEAENDFYLFSNTSMRDQFDTIASALAAGAIGISAIALLIGGVGVMNIMLVAVTERTREIGVRRALGARQRSILAQFVLEAVFLTSLGGAVGVGVGWLGSRAVAIVVGIPVVTPIWAVVLAMACSGGVGLLFGSYPAWHASRLDPVEAMRQE